MARSISRVIVRTGVLMVICLIAVAAEARTLCVSPSGDDAATGEVDAPLKTIRRALSLAQPGDDVLIAAGVYREGELDLPRSGEPDRPITIQAEPDAEVVLKGSRLATDWIAYGKDVWKIDDWMVNSQQLFVDGEPLQQIGTGSPLHTRMIAADKPCLTPVGQGLADLTPGSFFYEASSRTLYVMLPDRGDPNKHAMEASVDRWVLSGEDRSHIVIRGLTFMHSNWTATGGQHGLLRVGGTGWLIEDSTFTLGDFGGLHVTGERHTIRHCRMTRNGAIGINLNGSDREHGYRWYPDRPPQHIVFEDLQITDNNYRGFYEHWHAGGIKAIPACRAVTVRRCVVRDNGGPGIWFDGCHGQIVIEDNLVVGNRTGIFYEISAPAEGDAFGAMIRNNRVAGNRHQGIYVSASSAATVTGNTCDRNNWDIVIHGMPRREFGSDRALAGNVVEHNILHARHGDLVLYVGKGASNNKVDGNFYVDGDRPTSGPKAKTGIAVGLTTTTGYDPRPTTLQKLASDHGIERHGQRGDPQWADPASLDYRLGRDSPATGKGWQPSDDAAR